MRYLELRQLRWQLPPAKEWDVPCKHLLLPPVTGLRSCYSSGTAALLHCNFENGAFGIDCTGRPSREFAMDQKAIALMLGVRRERISEAAGKFQTAAPNNYRH